MDAKDFEKELGDLRARQVRPAKRVDYTVKNAGAKVGVSKALAVLFLLAMAAFGFFVLTRMEDVAAGSVLEVGTGSMLVGLIALVFLALGIYIAYKLWHIEFIGWTALFFISLAGIILPVLSAINHGIMAGTIPIVAASLVALAGLWWIRDLYRIKKLGDIFSPPR